jgi:ectoine hydroxylase-related dioxygenase (phytanoyl-CoA dioxygenase family)
MVAGTIGLTAEQKGQFERDGFLANGPIISAEELAAVRARIDAIAAGGTAVPESNIRFEQAYLDGNLPGVERRDTVWQMLGLAQHDEVIHQLVRHPRILDAVASLLGPDVKYYSDQVLMKSAKHGSAVNWHQDSHYWPIEPMNLVTCWLALDDATRENGCMCFLPGSHREGIRSHERNDQRTMKVEGIDESKVVAVPVPAGGCEFHHSLTLHATSANTTPYRRRAIAMSYMSAHSKDTRNPDKRYPLLRGQEYPGCV